MINGFKVVIDNSIPLGRVWKYPKRRFWEYIDDEETRKWTQYFGFGEWVPEHKVIQVGDTLYMRSETYENFKKHTNKLEKAQHGKYFGI